jgi:flagellar assembly protein FliH
VADAAVARGGCIVESDLGAIDASIETRWARAAAALGSRVGWTDDGGDAA